MLQQPTTTEEVQDLVRTAPRVKVRGGGSKSALCRDATLSTASLSGVVEYEPAEYTITALAGTPIVQIRDLLREHGQYLPFDPLFVEAGSTLGGVVASGLAGPARFRYGGVRDFLLGVRVVNGDGDLVRGGGKVVKNAAGFDIPKLMVGGLGRFGVMVEVTFKVFPSPEHSTTLVARYAGLESAIAALSRVSLSPSEVSALELLPPGELRVRVAGMASAQERHVERVEQLLASHTTLASETVRLVGAEQDAIWAEAGEMRWLPAGFRLIKVPLVPGQIMAAEQLFNGMPERPRRYSVGGNLLWLGWPDDTPLEPLDELLRQLGRSGLVVTGNCHSCQRNVPPPDPFALRLSRAFDPQGKFQSAGS